MAQNLFFQHALLPNGWATDVRVAITNGIISAIEQDLGWSGERHAIALPGMPNLHSHSFQRAIAGLTESRGETADSFWTWRDLMYRFALRMSPEDVETVATHAFIEMLEGGFCSVAEFHYLHHAPDGVPYANVAEMAERIAAAAAATGIDLTLLPVFYAHAGFGGKPPAPAQRRFTNDIKNYSKIYERCGEISAAGVAPHSLRAVTPEELGLLTKIAGDRPLHIHIAEQTSEVEECIAWSGLRPVEWLLRHAAVGENWCLIHATHANATERTGIARTGAVVGLCPITEANLGDGIFHAGEFQGRYGIGSDSNILISVAQELRLLEYAQRLLRRERNVMATDIIRSTATAMYQNAVTGGAKAHGVLPGLVLGAPANIVTIAGDNPDRALAHSIFAARSPMIENVWVRGKQCVENGRHLLAERSRQRFDDVVKKLI